MLVEACISILGPLGLGWLCCSRYLKNHVQTPVCSLEHDVTTLPADLPQCFANLTIQPDIGAM